MKTFLMGQIAGFSIALALAGATLCFAGQGPGYSFGSPAGKSDPCLGCHAVKGKVPATAFVDPQQFAHTTHARIGCPACHDGVSPNHPNSVKTPRAECRECHADIKAEYDRSIHAGKTSCAGCHNPHRVETPKEISGAQINQMCSGCHDNFRMTAKHSEWLPQAELHLRMLPCITCHTASKSYFISMYIVKGHNGDLFGKQEVAGYQDLLKLAPKGKLVSLIDSNGDGFVSLQELRDFNARSRRTSLHLQGMMTPQTVTHKFEILDSRRNCTFCHASGPTAQQESFVALPLQDGTFRRVPVERGAVLGVLYGAPDFYMMGSTKSSRMNLIGAAIICCGLIMPVGHGFLRFLTRKNRK